MFQSNENRKYWWQMDDQARGSDAECWKIEFVCCDCIEVHHERPYFQVLQFAKDECWNQKVSNPWLVGTNFRLRWIFIHIKGRIVVKEMCKLSIVKASRWIYYIIVDP